MTIMTDVDLYAHLRGVIKHSWYNLPDYPGYRGTGGPGLVLEELLGLSAGSSDTPDAGKWEIKFHSPKTQLLTLFHLEAEPKGHMHHMVREFGWKNDKGQTCFRHTIHKGQSSLDFYIANESNRITVRHPHVSDIVWPYWTHDRLINAFAQKLRRLIAVRGSTRKSATGKKEVRYDAARLYWEPQTTLFVGMIANGMIAIDFDSRTKNGRGLRNHGTKFRIPLKDLSNLYLNSQRFD